MRTLNLASRQDVAPTRPIDCDPALSIIMTGAHTNSRGWKSQPHTRYLRKGRVSQTGRIYHIRTSTAARQPLFREFHLGRVVVNSLRFLHDRGDVESLAFVVMPDHLHWLFQLGDSRPLDRVIQSMKSHTAKIINSHRGMSGDAVWQPGYFDRALRVEEEVRAIARYIVANPLRAGLCRQIGDYPLWDAVWL